MVKGQEKIQKQIKSQNGNIRNILHQTEKLNNINLGSLLDEICPNYESIRRLLSSNQHHHLRHNNNNDLTNIISNIPQKVKDFINETAIQTIFKDISEINTIADVKLKHKSDKKKLMNGSYPSIHANQWDYLGIKPQSIYIQNEVAICVPATILTVISLLLSLEKKNSLLSPKKWIKKHLLSIPINLWRKYVSFQSIDLRLFHNMYLKDGMILQCHQEWESEINNKCSSTPELHKIITNLNIRHHPQAFAAGIKADNWSHLILIFPGQCLHKHQFIGKYLCISTDVSMKTTKSKISKQIFLLDPKLDNKNLYGSDAFVDYLQTIGSEAEVDWIYSLYIDNNNNNDNNSTKSDNFQELKVNNDNKNDNNHSTKHDNFKEFKDNFKELKDNFKPVHNVGNIVWNICYSDDGKRTAWLCKIIKQTAIPFGIIDENAGCFKKDDQWEEVIELFRKRKKKYIICCLVRYMGLTSKENEKLDFSIHDEWVDEDQLIKFEQNDLKQHGLKINYGKWINNIKVIDNNSNNNYNNNDNNSDNDNDNNNNNNDTKNIDKNSNDNNRKLNKKRKRYKRKRSDDDDDAECIYIENKQKKKKLHD